MIVGNNVVTDQQTVAHFHHVCCCPVPGILVLHAKEGGPAWRAGMKGTSRDEYGRLVLGDIITGIDGMKVKNSSDLYRLLDQCKVGCLLTSTGTCNRRTRNDCMKSLRDA